MGKLEWDFFFGTEEVIFKFVVNRRDYTVNYQLLFQRWEIQIENEKNSFSFIFHFSFSYLLLQIARYVATVDTFIINADAFLIRANFENHPLHRYSVFHWFRHAKFANGGSILRSSQFSMLPHLPHKIECASKVVKIDPKIIILVPKI